MIAHLAGHGAKRFQIGKQVAEIFDPSHADRRYRERRESNELLAGDIPLVTARDEFGLGPSPDAVDRIGRDIRRVERPEWRRYREAAAEFQAIGLAGHGMAGGTSSGVERCQAVGKVRRIGLATPTRAGGAVSHQKMRKSRCRQQQPDTRKFVAAFTDPSLRPFHSTASMAAVRAIGCLKISRNKGLVRE